MTKDYSILIGGAAGQGSRRAGFVIAKLFSKLGYRIFIYDDYQSLVRGGHNFSQIRASEKSVLSHRRKIDFLLALNRDTVEKHIGDLDKKGIVVYNSDEIGGSDSVLKLSYQKFQTTIGLPIRTITKKAKGMLIMENIALLAGFAKIVGIDWLTLSNVLKQEFKKSLKLNLHIAKIAFNDAQSFTNIKKLPQKKPLQLLTGNQAVALGAVKAGLNLYIAYPMTPATGILLYLAENSRKLNVGVSQLENEIGVVNAALGSAYSGARTMVGTSGGGFALMVEALSLSVQAEIPIVIVESQRAAPATGVPTYTAQGDLLFVLNAGHGDILKFVIVPGDAEEAFIWAGKALDIAWEYQTPVVLLVDKEVSESTFDFNLALLKKVRIKKPLLWDKKGKYERYKDTKTGISPLAFPGDKKAVVKTTSYEHDEFGITVEDEKSVIKMQNKRLRKFKKMKQAIEKMPAVKVYGKKNSKMAVIAWGSTKGPAKEVAEKIKIKMIQPIILEPFPEKQIKKALKGVEKLVLIETNATGQLGKVLNHYSIKVDKEILKYDARPFFPDEILKNIKNQKSKWKITE